MNIKFTAVIVLLLLSAQLTAAEINPRAIEENAMGKEFFESQMYEEAIEHFMNAIEIEPRYAEAHSNLGLVYYHLGMYEKALDEFKTAVSIAPDVPQYHIYLAGAYERNGMIEEAKKELETYLALTERRGDEEANMAVREVLDILEGIDAEARYRDIDIMPADIEQSLFTADIEQPLFTFIVISDVHMGENFHGGTQDSDYLYWILNDAYDYIKPAFIVNTGDITDSTNGGLIPMGGPYQEEWDEYRSIVDPVMSPEVYYDIPGNHDQYRDGSLSYYLENSMQGRATGSTQQVWFFTYGIRYEFISVCTAGNDGKPWPIDNAGLDQNELEWINSVIDASADMIFFFGHHPLDRLKYGKEEFESILRSTPSVYIYGHTHKYGISYYDGHMLVNAASLGKSLENHYLLVKVGSNSEFSVTPYNAYELPG